MLCMSSTVRYVVTPARRFAATTITDVEGRYVLCGIPRGLHEFAATAEGYDIFKNPVRSIDVAGDMTLDLQLRR